MLDKIGSLNSLRVFEVAGRKLSFAKAAEELHITQGAVSYQIRELESRLGLKLFKREIRKINLTAAGERLHKVTRRALADIDSEIQMLTTNQSTLTLTVAVSTYVTTRWLSKRLTGFLNAHPDTALQLRHAVNTPDFEVGMYDLAIRWGKAPWRDAMSTELLPMPMMPVCAPALLNGKRNLAKHPEDLRLFTLLRDQGNVDLWSAWLDKAGVPHESITSNRIIADPVVRTQAAIDGQGVMLADELVDTELANGDLVAPFDISLEGYGYHLLWDRNEEPNRVTKSFLHWITAQVKR